MLCTIVVSALEGLRDVMKYMGQLHTYEVIIECCFRDVMQYIKDKDLKAAPIVYEVPPAPVAKPAAAVPPPPPPSTVAPPIVPTPQQTSPPSIPSPAVTQGAQFVDVELTNMRKTIAKRLTESKVIIIVIIIMIIIIIIMVIIIKIMIMIIVIIMVIIIIIIIIMIIIIMIIDI